MKKIKADFSKVKELSVVIDDVHGYRAVYPRMYDRLTVHYSSVFTAICYKKHILAFGMHAEGRYVIERVLPLIDTSALPDDIVNRSSLNFEFTKDCSRWVIGSVVLRRSKDGGFVSFDRLCSLSPIFRDLPLVQLECVPKSETAKVTAASRFTQLGTLGDRLKDVLADAKKNLPK